MYPASWYEIADVTVKRMQQFTLEWNQNSREFRGGHCFEVSKKLVPIKRRFTNLEWWKPPFGYSSSPMGLLKVLFYFPPMGTCFQSFFAQIFRESAGVRWPCGIFSQYNLVPERSIGILLKWFLRWICTTGICFGIIFGHRQDPK